MSITSTSTDSNISPNAELLAPGAAARIPTVEGALMFSNRGNGDPTTMDPERLANALKAQGERGEKLAAFLPNPTTAGTAIRNAISRVTASLRAGRMEWREVEEKDASGNRVVLLLAITADADAQTLDARKLGAVLVDPQGTPYGVAGNSAVQGCVDTFIATYLREKGIMGSQQLWATAQAIAFSSYESFSCNAGQMFVTGQAEKDLIQFDSALHSLGSHYRIRHMAFIPALHGEAFREDALSAMMVEIKTLRSKFAEKADKAAQNNKDVPVKSVLSTVEEITDLMARYKLMGRMLAAESAEFLAEAEALKQEALKAVTDRK